jgi:anti-sigma-K factor RskA
MKYEDPKLREHLAGQYALGALHGAARRRFEQLLRRDPALRRLVNAWEDRLIPLAAETAPVAPPPRVFAAIERRIGAGGGARPGLWERLGFWRAMSLVGATAVVVLAVATTFFITRPPAMVPASYLAVLADQSAKPTLILTAYKNPWLLTVEPLGVAPPPPGKVLQVWAIEKDTGIVRPLLAIASAQSQQIRLSESEWKLVRTAQSLAVNLEAAGTAPATPTSPVLYSGLCINLKG